MEKKYIQPDIEIHEIEVEHLCAGSDGFAWDDEMDQGSAGYGDDYAEEDALAKEHNSVWDEWQNSACPTPNKICER